MRFQAIHKIASYLMAACAFGAVALSEELNAIVVLGGLAGIVVSWFWEPPRVRPERWSVWWNAAALAAFAYTVLAVFIGGSWIVGGTQLLVFLLIAKLFNRRSSRDYQWVYVVSFLLLVAGTTLNAELSYALCFMGYVVFATWALILFHLRREMEDNFLLKHSDDSSSERVEVERILNSRRIVGGKFLAATSAVSLAIFLVSSFLFLLFPRVGFGLFFHQNQRRVAMAGLNESGVTLGGHGRILDDDTVVMRVKVSDPRFKGMDAPAIHWRAVSFDQYHDGRWRRSRDAETTPLEAEIDQGRRTTYLTIDHPFLPSWRNQGLWRDGLVRQEIFLEAMDTTSLIAASKPVGFELPDATQGRYKGPLLPRNRNGDVRHFFTGQLAYVAYSDLRRPDEKKLRAARDVAAGAMKPYLDLPATLPPRIRALAEEITRGKDGPWAKALAVESWLQANFTYTLELETDDAREPLDYFLFDRKQGHCEYFASAEAILLRAVGVPTRNVNGFAGGEWNEYGGYWAVRAGDAHSWVEIWIDGVGWVTRDPTPAAATPLGRGGGGPLDKLRRMVDTLRLKWFKWVIEYDLGRQLGLFKDLGESLGLSGKASGSGLKQLVKQHKWALLGVLGGAIALVVAIRRFRRRRVGTADGVARKKPRAPAHPVITLWTKSAKRMARQGFPRPPGQTPREHATSLVTRGAPGGDPFVALTELYYTARFAESEHEVAKVDVDAARRLAEQIEEAVQARRVSR